MQASTAKVNAPALNNNLFIVFSPVISISTIPPLHLAQKLVIGIEMNVLAVTQTENQVRIPRHTQPKLGSSETILLRWPSSHLQKVVYVFYQLAFKRHQNGMSSLNLSSSAVEAPSNKRPALGGISSRITQAYHASAVCIGSCPSMQDLAMAMRVMVSSLEPP